MFIQTHKSYGSGMFMLLDLHLNDQEVIFCTNRAEKSERKLSDQEVRIKKEDVKLIPSITPRDITSTLMVPEIQGCR